MFEFEMSALSSDACRESCVKAQNRFTKLFHQADRFRQSAAPFSAPLRSAISVSAR